MKSVLIIDDSPEDREWLADVVDDFSAGDVRVFEDVEEALVSFRERPADLVLLDDWLGAKRGWAYAPSFQAISPRATIAITSGVPFANVDQLSKTLHLTFFIKKEITEKAIRDLFVV